MANSNETPQEEKKMPMDDQKPTTSEPKQKPAKNYLAILSLIIAIAAVATTIYTLQLNQQLHERFNDQKNQMTARLNDLSKQQSSIENSINSTGQNLKDTEKEIQDQLKGLHQQFKLTMEQQAYESQDWMLMKARYYLELAQINAHWSDNNKTTLALLQQADMILANISTQNVFDIRQAIAKEILLVKASSQLDIAGLLSQLDAMGQTINNLPMLSLPSAKATSTETQASPKTNAKAWKERLQDSVNMLEKLVVIRHHDENIKPLLSPIYIAVVRENIRLNLQEAQWAILKRNNDIFQLAIKDAVNNIKRNFDSQSSETQALLSQLNELKELNLNQPRPDLAIALPLLNQLIEQKQTSPEDKKSSRSKGEQRS